MAEDLRTLYPLRPYQQEAVDMAVERRSLLLALTMGAGKTRVAIEAVREYGHDIGLEENRDISGLIFCTNSLKYQWQSEIEKWTGGVGPVIQVIDGPKVKRRQQYEAAAEWFILSYDMLIHDWEILEGVLPDFIVADEATLIKSFKAQRSKRLKKLAVNVPFRLALTGQPVENRPEELFSIMEFVDPSVLGTFFKFDRTFIVRDNWGRPQRYRNLNLLNNKMSKAMYRKSREDIEEFLPKKNSIDLPVRLYPKSQRLYDHIRDDLLSVLENMEGGSFNVFAHYGRADDEESNRLKGEVMSRITAMRLLSNHPDLLLRSADDFDDEETKTGSKYASALKSQGLLVEEPSAKLNALMDFIDELSEERPDFKLVIFCGFKPMLRIIGAELRERRIGFTSMTGDTPSEKRHERMTKFNTDRRVRVFLSSDAGAYGINLDRGTHLINYDLPWSAGALDQRVARIDRTSSEQDHIDIVYMYCDGSVEEYQYGLLKEKAKVAKAFVDGKGFDVSGSLTLDLDSLKQFMLSGVD